MGIYINKIVHLTVQSVPFHLNSDPSVITDSNSGIRLNLDARSLHLFPAVCREEQVHGVIL